MSTDASARDVLDEPPYGPRVIRSADTGGVACVGSDRTPVSEVLSLMAAGKSRAQILTALKGIEPEDVDASLAFAAWLIQQD